MAKRWTVVLVSVLAAVMLTSTVGAGAQTTPLIDSGPESETGAVPQQPPSTLTETVNPAIASYAADYSVSEAEAERRLARLDGISEVLQSIRELDSERVAGWGIDHGETLTGWVWLTGTGAASTEAVALADAHADIEIRVGAAHTYAELRDAQDGFGDGSHIVAPGTTGAVGHATGGSDLLQDLPSIVTFTGLDLRSNGIYIGIDPSLAADASTGSAIVPGGLMTPDPIASTDGNATDDTSLETAIAQLTTDLDPHISVAFEVVDGRGAGFSADFDGGRGMRTCTSGFAAVTNDTGVYGIVTAGHCSNTQRMQGVSLPWVRGYESRRADAQFHEIPTGANHVLYDDYVCNTSGWWDSECDVSGDIARMNMQDHYVCHTGMNTGTSCGTVEDISHRPSYYGACRYGSETGRRINCSSVFVLVEGPSLYSCEGDSGGPWFSYGTAYGIHMGTVNQYPTCYEPVSGAIFSAIDEVESFLNVDILSNGSVTIE